MAKQIAGLCFLEGTFDKMTFYKMDGEYYVRKKSSLTSERVKESPEFAITMYYAGLLSRSAKIGSKIYRALPESWRQFWMYRSFTGEAFTMLKSAGMTEEEVTQALWKTYVAYWQQWEAANANKAEVTAIKAAKQPRSRKRRTYTREALLRLKDKQGRPRFIDPVEVERKRQLKAIEEAAIQRWRDRERSLWQRLLPVPVPKDSPIPILSMISVLPVAV